MRPGTVISARGFVAFVMLGVATPLAAQTLGVPAQKQQPRKQHVVKKGDTLWDLAQFYLNDPFRWGAIYEANKNVVKNPHWIYPSEKLVIPFLAADSLAGTPVVADVAPQHSRFYVPERVDTGATLISTAVERPSLVQAAEWLAAPWLADTAQIQVKARVFKPYDPRDQYDKLPQFFHPLDKLYLTITTPVAVNDRLLAFRFERDVKGSGWIVLPEGVLRVDSISGQSAVATITSQFGDLKVGDVAMALQPVPTMPVGSLTPVTGGPNGAILDFLVEHPLYNDTDYAFINLGTAQGLAIGDELIAYMPDRQPSAKHPETLAEQPIARLQVVRADARTSTVRVTRLSNTGLETGLPVRVARKAP